jgi:hypothetical protein
MKHVMERQFLAMCPQVSYPKVFNGFEQKFGIEDQHEVASELSLGPSNPIHLLNKNTNSCKIS